MMRSSMIESENFSFEEFHRLIRESTKSNPELQLVKADSLYIRLAQWMMDHYGNVFNYNFYRPSNAWRPSQTKLRLTLSPIVGRKRGKVKEGEATRKLARWSHYVFIFTTYMTLKLLISLFFQYDFNRKWLRLKELAKSCHSDKEENLLYASFQHATNISCLQPSVGFDANKQWRIFHGEYMEARSWLKLIGSPYLNLNFALECTYIFIIVLTISVYFGLYIYTSFFHGQLDVSTIKMILALPEERDNNFELIRLQVNSFIQSSRTFARINLDRFSLVWRLQSNRSSGKEQPISSYQASKLSKEELLISFIEHKQCVEQLKQLAIDGSLQPLNKTQTVIRYNALAYVVFLTITFVGLTAFHVGLTQVVPQLMLFVGFKFELDPMDILFYIELPLILTVDAHISSLSLVLPLLSCVDQIFYANRIRRMIEDCKDKVVNITRARELGIGGGGRSPETAGAQRVARQIGVPKMSIGSRVGEAQTGSFELKHRRRLSGVATDEVSDVPEATRSISELRSALLPTLMHYKIFAAQFEPLKKTFSATAPLAFSVAVTVPILTRIYFQYLDPSTRNLLAAIAAGFGITINTSFFPICELHCRCQDVNRELACLLAHAVDAFSFRQHVSDFITSSFNKGDLNHLMSNDFGLTDNHIVWLLRKELNHSDRMVNRFTIKSLGIPLTYGTMIKIHFWLGILVVPTIFGSYYSQGGLQVDRLLGYF